MREILLEYDGCMKDIEKVTSSYTSVYDTV